MVCMLYNFFVVVCFYIEGVVSWWYGFVLVGVVVWILLFDLLSVFSDFVYCYFFVYLNYGLF